VASKILHVANFVDRNFYVASVPVQRLHVHVQKLVDAGYKVGIVKQTETAALKAVGSNRNQVFERELTQVLTKGTIVDEMYEPVTTCATGYLMCLVEEKRGGNGPDDRMYTGIVAVQPSTGDIIYDTFEDTFMRKELETRLLHIEPSEVLVPCTMSNLTEKLIKHMSAGEGAVRIEQMPLDDTFCTDYNAAMTYVSDFYSESEKSEMLPIVIKLPDIIIKVLAALIRYLKEFNLSNLLYVSKYITNFVSKSHMLLNANTLVNLEIYHNNTNKQKEGSLFSILDHTLTKFGQRQLRKWVGQPLVDTNKLNERVNAIDELLTSTNPKKDKILVLLKRFPDVEKGLCRIHYGRSSPTEVVQVLDALSSVSELFFNSQEPQFRSNLLNRLFDSLTSIRDDVLRYKEMIDPNHALDMTQFLRSEAKWPEIPRERRNIQFLENLLYDHLDELKHSTGLKDLHYTEVSGIEFLLVVENKKTKLVPGEWIKIGGTKSSSRFHSRYIIERLKERQQHQEKLNILAEVAFKELMNQANYVKPEYTKEKKIDIKSGRHPILEKMIPYVANDICFSNSQSAMILTGPNMGGKSSYVRQIALLCMMGQIGSYVPAESATLCVLDAIYTRMGASDNMMRGESTFMVELHETSDIMKLATSNSL
ncbi:Mismatch repair protein msh3, partial [Rhizopus stolonifer]